MKKSAASTADDTTPPVSLDGFTPAQLLELYDALLLPRVIEEKMLNLLRQGRLSKWFSGIGQEAIAVGVASALHEDDWLLPMHRNLGVFTTRGLEPARLFRQLLGKAGGWTKGRDRTFHFGALEHRVVGMISHLGAMMPVADGLALAEKLRGTGRVAATFTGDGATSEGDFHEACNLAAVWKLPVLLIIENNQYGLSTPVEEQYACKDLADRAIGYGIPGVIVDGNDILAVHRAVSEAAERARRGDGPTLMEFKTFRMRGHEEASGTDYIPAELFEEWGKKDPILRLDRALVAAGILRDGEGDTRKAAIKERIDALVEAAILDAEPDSSAQQELADVYVPSGVHASEPSAEGAPELRYIDAISDGLRTAMRDDERVLLLGQDIAEYGGAFKITKGFVDEFGRDRVRNTPIIESGAIGCAMGLALNGFRPMIEMQFGDFISCGFNQIVNNLAKTHYRWAAGVPVVIRVPSGGGTGAGPFHSQNVEAWFTHVPGLKVVAPSNPYDAKGLLLAAFQDGNPVLYLEHKMLYRSVKGGVPAQSYAIPLGKGHIVRPGTDATVVTYGAAVHWAVEAANALAAEGAGEVEVVDLRTLLPWDVELVLDSVMRTSRALVLHEAPVTGGYGAEIAATIAQDAFDYLDAPVQRLGGLDVPLPFSKKLEEIALPKARVMETLRTLLEY